MTHTASLLAGQRLMVGFDGTAFNADLAYLIDTLNVGGVILFAANISAPDQLQQLCADIQGHARAGRRPPLFIAIDQEGGQVARLKKPFSEFPGGSPAMRDEADAESFAAITARELTLVGVNMDMAPVLDIAFDPALSVMSGRAFGADPDRVTRLGLTVVRTLQREGILAVAKHFPGIGRTTLDSHRDLPRLATDYDILAASDLLPFKAAARADVAGIMLSHILYQGLDPDWPASLSSRIADGLLRRGMGYDGLVMTDDLDMGAIARHYDIRTCIRRILAAGIDLALICHKSPKIETAYEEIARCLRDDPDLATSGERCLARILRFKDAYLSGGILPTAGAAI
jgi:beta-N-acetylhexosaminidase